MTEKVPNKQDIFQFINQEKKKPSLNEIPKSSKLFIKLLQKTINDILLKIKNFCNIETYDIIKTAIDLLWHVFWIIYSFSFNIKLTMFLSERSILLFIEFILMSRNPILNNDLEFTPSINDAFQFSLKKTIGPLKNPQIKSIKIKNVLNFYKELSFDYKYFYCLLIKDLLNYSYNNLIKINFISYEEYKGDYEDLCNLEFINLDLEDNKLIKFFDLLNNYFQKLIINTLNKYQNYNRNIIFDLIKLSFLSNFDVKIKLFQFKFCLELCNDFNIDDLNIDIKFIFDKVNTIFIENNSELENFNLDYLSLLKKKKIYKKLHSYFLKLQIPNN